MDRVRNTKMQILKYAPPAGIDSYREKLVDYYHRFEINVAKKDILVTTGASEAISLVLSSCLDVGDEVIVPEPFYANYLGYAHATGVKIKPIPTFIEDSFALPNISEFTPLIGPKTKASFLCNPNNPTGGIYGKADLETLGRLVKKHDLYLIVDEVYREFCYDDDFYSVLRLNGLEHHTVVIDSISKRFSACGARIGSIVSQNESLIKACLTIAQLRLSAPGFGQLLGEATLDLPPNYLETIKEEYDLRRRTLIGRLKKIPGVVCYLPKGAFYAFARLPITNSEKFCQWMLASFDYNNETVMLAPGTGFYATKGRGLDEVRIAYILNTTDIEKAMDCLEAGLERYKKRNS